MFAPKNSTLSPENGYFGMKTMEYQLLNSVRPQTWFPYLVWSDLKHGFFIEKQICQNIVMETSKMKKISPLCSGLSILLTLYLNGD
jgi:hypothetical protein